ncbi:branched-chain amino acid ABC transporter permease [Aurantimonas sp. Leaf443]|uniref:branched-chain amino acid ABC transporter permease n=1 Tax=Aurantimonas sp. Leaf443 TaxID=1736378 RepID=UPI0006FA1FAA|nr:branched-chain amino acid ABC transporter permease [Aurantimonas sp. Leaf443]KQT85247.1 branched-chain amino acid ABC transporter permease [Aurantimonas sp. Leaf443]
MRRAALLVVVALLLALPFLAGPMLTLGTIVLAKALAVLGVFLLLQAGQVSFGHGMFFAVGAYSAAYIGAAWRGADLLVLAVAAAGLSALAGLVVGLFVARYRSIFFGMLNLAFSMVLFAVLEKFFHLTGGTDGMRIRRPTLLGFEFGRGSFDLVLYYFVLGLSLLCALLVWQYLRSPIGQALKALKSNETRLEYIGLSARNTVLAAYVLSAVLCGLGGLSLGIVQGLATPDYTFWTRSSEFVFIAVLGGTGHVVGAFAGSLVYEAVRFYAAALLDDSWQLILGAVLIAIILGAPGGIIDLPRRFGLAGRKRKAEAAPTDAAPAMRAPYREGAAS